MKHIASDMSLWMKATAFLGIDRRYEFECRTVSERVKFLNGTFGRNADMSPLLEYEGSEYQADTRAIEARYQLGL